MEYTKSFDFSELDRPEKSLKKTARDMVMSLQTLDRSNTKLFWSIDKDNTSLFFEVTVYRRIRRTILN